MRVVCCWLPLIFFLFARRTESNNKKCVSVSVSVRDFNICGRYIHIFNVKTNESDSETRLWWHEGLTDTSFIIQVNSEKHSICDSTFVAGTISFWKISIRTLWCILNVSKIIPVFALSICVSIGIDLSFIVAVQINIVPYHSVFVFKRHVATFKSVANR